MFDPSRRQFLQSAAVSAAGLVLSSSLRSQARTGGETGAGEPIFRLDEGWEFHSGSLDGAAAAWQPNGQLTWEPVTLPHCFNAKDACDPDHPYFRGQGWYRRRIPVRSPFAGGRTLLHFQGAGQTTTLWIGSTRVGMHVGGYDEFAFDVTDAIAKLTPAERTGGLPVLVICDNIPDHDRIPSELSDFCLYGGLYRHVNLVHLPATALDAVHILPAVLPSGDAHVSVAARLYNPVAAAGPCHVMIEVSDPRGEPVHRDSQTLATWKGFGTVAEFRVANPKLWSPTSPNLYRCRVKLTIASGELEIEQRFGVRHVEFVEHGAFKLNGERLLLRGTQRHQDHAGVAAAMSDEQTREELRLIREMGANFIRLAHYQQDPLVLDLCDELGLIVWEEMPWCRAGVGGEAFQQNATAMLTHMIEQHYNHPSVVFWGLGNEDDWPGEYPSMNPEAIRAFMTKMRDLAHELDPSRLTAVRRCDFARDIPDVYSPSIWAGWYRGSYREYLESLTKERNRVGRFIHIEWGADSHAGRHAEDPDENLGQIPTGEGTDERGLAYLKTGGEARVSSKGDWSETYACLLFDWHLKTQESLDWLSGSAQWVFKDFASPQRGDNGIPFVNQKGVVERDLKKKESYWVFQSYWSEKPMAHIYGHSWPVRWGAKGQQRSVQVYSNCDRAELFLNNVSQGEKVRDIQDFPAAGLHWNVAFAPGPNQLRVIAHKGNITVSDEINQTYQTEPWGAPARLTLVEKTREGQRGAVEAKLLDAHGVLCLSARNFVRFSLQGAGRLIDNLGTTRGSRELELANGRATISFHATGPFKIEAAIEGVPVATLEVES